MLALVAQPYGKLDDPAPRPSASKLDDPFVRQVLPATLRRASDVVDAPRPRPPIPPALTRDERLADVEWHLAQLTIDVASPPIVPRAAPAKAAPPAPPETEGYAPPPTRAEFDALAAEVRALRADLDRLRRPAPAKVPPPVSPSVVVSPPAVQWVQQRPPIGADPPMRYGAFPAAAPVFFAGPGFSSAGAVCGPGGCGPAPAGLFRGGLFGGGWR